MNLSKNPRPSGRGEVRTGLIDKFKAKMGKNVMTPEILDYITFDNNIIELSEGIGLTGKPIYGLTTRRYDEETDNFVSLGFSRLFTDKNKLVESANLLKETNLCTSIETKEQESFCDEYIKDIEILVKYRYKNGH